MYSLICEQISVGLEMQWWKANKEENQYTNETKSKVKKSYCSEILLGGVRDIFISIKSVQWW